MDDKIISLAAFQKKAADPITEDAAALEFAERHRNCLRFDHNRGKWFHWTGTHWKCEQTKLAFSWARELARDLCKKQSKKTKYITSKASFAAAVERFAQADRAFAVTSEIWDRDQWALNTPGGIVDLRTGETRQAVPEDYCTKITATAAGGDCPTWLAFLQRVTGNSDDLIRYLQRMCGYALTGCTREHAMFFTYGTGANGKTVFLDTVSGILADFHATAPIEAFTSSKSDRHPTDLAGLRGARLVTAVETEEGRHWAEAKIKTLTGGDKISARFMRQDFFEFTPGFKLLIAGNHKPALRTVDEAIKRRINIIPFAVTIPPKDRDRELTEKLKTEWPGILQWMINGCLEWQASGLQAPKAVQDTTAQYFEAEDAFSTWIEDCCERNPQAWEFRKDLFASWSVWAVKAGEPVGAQKQLVQKMESRGFRPGWKHGGRTFYGLKLIGGNQ